MPSQSCIISSGKNEMVTSHLHVEKAVRIFLLRNQYPTFMKGILKNAKHLVDEDVLVFSQKYVRHDCGHSTTNSKRSGSRLWSWYSKMDRECDKLTFLTFFGPLLLHHEKLKLVTRQWRDVTGYPVDAQPWPALINSWVLPPYCSGNTPFPISIYS